MMDGDFQKVAISAATELLPINELPIAFPDT